MYKCRTTNKQIYKTTILLFIDIVLFRKLLKWYYQFLEQKIFEKHFFV